METSGKYTVSYTPSSDPHEYLQVAVEMSISSEATLSDMAAFFTDFLRASGYVFDGELTMTEPFKEETSESLRSNFWEDDGVSCVGNPWEARLGNDTLDTVHVGSGLFGAAGEDHLSFRSPFGNDVITFN
jgi:hypothetical protein